MSEPPDRDALHWTITRAEWDGHARRTRRNAVLLVVLLVLVMLSFLTMSLLPLLLGVAQASPFKVFMVIEAVVLGIFCLLAIVGAGRTFRAWRTLAAEAWETDGAACPRCLNTLPEDGSPCKHGLTRAHAPLLRAYWEAVATRDMERALRAGAELPYTMRNLLARAKHMHVRWLAWLWDTRSGPWRLMVLQLAFTIPILAILFWLTPLPLAMVPMMLCMVIGIPLLVQGVGITQRGMERCSRCGQKLGGGTRPALCPECGRSLDEPGAVTSTERRRYPGMIAGGVLAILLGMIFPVLLYSGVVLSALPTGALLLLARMDSNFAIMDELTSRPLTPDQLRAMADTLLQQTEGNAPYVFGLEEVAKAVEAQTLPPEYGQRLAHAAVGMRIIAPESARVGEAVRLVLRPRQRLFAHPRGGEYAWLMTGWSVDEASPVDSRSRWVPISYWDAGYRQALNLQVEEEEYTLEHVVTPTQPGTMTIRARGWVTLLPFVTDRSETLDEQGHPARAATQPCYPVEITHTIQVRP